ncbi:MAG: hypothetical protein K8W52_32540 [Deltaproteobacteria bacterium]|nr:hypothetical protein [Deltaproteobacteria bacterium]
MSYYIRYFAAQPVTSKAIHQALQALDPTFKIDLGELLAGDAALGQIEVNQAQGDMFEDDLAQTLRLVAASGQGQAVIPRLKSARSIVVVNLEWDALGSEAVLAKAAPLWTALAQLSPGLSQWDGSGIYDGAQQLVDLSAVR